MTRKTSSIIASVACCVMLCLSSQTASAEEYYYTGERNDSQYTADQYSEERASQQLSFNLNDPEVVGCAVANNYFYGYEGEPHTNWFQ